MFDVCPCVRGNVPTVCFCGWDRLQCLGVCVCIKGIIYASCVCVSEWLYERPVSQSASHWVGRAHTTLLWGCSLCCQLFECIVLLAGCLFKQSPVSHCATTHTLTHICYATVKTAPTTLHDRVGVAEGRRCVCLSTWKRFVLRNTALSRPLLMDEPVL